LSDLLPVFLRNPLNGDYNTNTLLSSQYVDIPL
jgi:hypothetical protein